MQLHHTISFNFDSELNKEVQDEPIVFGSYHNIIKATWQTDTSNTIIFEDSIVCGAVYIGTVMCHIKTSIFDHFIVKFGYRENRFVLVKNENVTIGPAVPAFIKPRYEAKLHYLTHPHYIGYCQTSTITELPDNLPISFISGGLVNRCHSYGCIRIGKIVGYIHDDIKKRRYFVVKYNHDMHEIVSQTQKIVLSSSLQTFLKSSAHFFKGKRCEIISTCFIQDNIWHHINCAGAQLVNYVVPAKHMFATNLNSQMINEVCSNDSFVVDDVINLNDYMSQYKGE